MIKIELNIDGELKDFNIPEGWNEVSIATASDLFSLEREGKNQLELIVSIVSILSGVDEEVIYMMTQDQFLELTEVIKFTNEEIKSELKDFITIDGEDYYLKKDFEKLNVGEIISIDTIMTTNNNDLSKSMAKLLCILLRKKKENGEYESFRNNFMEREELFNKIMITDVNDIFLFFSDGRNTLDNNTPVSLDEKK
jgi:hypothetical protein